MVPGSQGLFRGLCYKKTIYNTKHIYYVDWTKQAGVFIIIKVTLHYLY